MAGHSHSANIAVRKGAQDKARGKLFTKLCKEVFVAAKTGGPDPDSNARLRLAITKARGKSVPKDSIEKAIARASGNLDSGDYEEVTMEGYGPGGVAILAHCLTDNRNRTAAEVRHAFTKGNGNLGTSGCVSYLFQRRGILFVASDDEDTVMLTALDHGALDVTTEADGFEVLTNPEDLETCGAALLASDLEIRTNEVMMVPDTRVTVTGDDADKLFRLLELLGDCDDVQQVDHNAEIAPEDLERIQAE